MPNSKIFQDVAFVPENGLFAATPQSLGWGDPLSWKTPGASDGIAYLALDNSLEIVKVEDQSITGDAAKAAKRTVGRRVDSVFNFHYFFNGSDYWLYWMMGFVNNSQQVVVFSASNTPWRTSEPEAGTVFEDTTLPTPLEFTYLRKFKAKDAESDIVTMYVFAATAVPLLAAGDLTEVDPGTETFTYTAHSVVKYQRMYELDTRGNFYRDYTSAEQSALDDYSAGDVKNAMVTLCKRFESHDVRYGNCICRGWKYSSPADEMARFETNFLAWDEDLSSSAGGYGSDDWTIPATFDDNTAVPANYQTVIELGESVATFATACPSTFTIGNETPYQKISTTCSGLKIAKPILEGYFNTMFTANIARYENKTFQTFRDGDTRLFGRIGINNGYDTLEFLMKNLILETAGPDNGDVAAEPISGELSKCAIANDDFKNSGYLYGHTQLQNKPLIILTINDMDASPMFQY